MVIVRSPTAIREAEGAEFEAIRDVAEAANEEFRPAMGDTLFAGYLANVLDIKRRAREATVLVAVSGQDVVGTITVYRDINQEGMPTEFPVGTAGIRSTAVAPAARGMGIGSDLVAAAISSARSLGAQRMALHTAACMESAMRLYERHGFRRAPEHDFVANDFFTAGAGETLEAMAFVLDLDGTA